MNKKNLLSHILLKKKLFFNSFTLKSNSVCKQALNGQNFWYAKPQKSEMFDIFFYL